MKTDWESNKRPGEVRKDDEENPTVVALHHCRNGSPLNCPSHDKNQLEHARLYRHQELMQGCCSSYQIDRKVRDMGSLQSITSPVDMR